jgi:hypothetical protein
LTGLDWLFSPWKNFVDSSSPALSQNDLIDSYRLLLPVTHKVRSSHSLYVVILISKSRRTIFFFPLWFFLWNDWLSNSLFSSLTASQERFWLTFPFSGENYSLQDSQEEEAVLENKIIGRELTASVTVNT